jgi:hypothetical protein
MRRRAIWIGAGAATAARLARRVYRARREATSDGHRLTIRATVAPEVVADLEDLLRRVSGRAASDQHGAITVSLAPGAEVPEVERDLRAVVHRWSEMHPGVRVHVGAGAEVSEPRRQRRFRRRVQAEQPVAVASLDAPRPG